MSYPISDQNPFIKELSLLFTADSKIMSLQNGWLT